MRKYILGLGLASTLAIAAYCLWSEPINAIFMFLGALGATLYLEFMTAIQQGKKQTTPENEWTGV